MPAYCPAFEQILPGADFNDFNGKGFSYGFDVLEEMANTAGVTPLSGFFDNSASYGEDLDPPDFEPGPTEWFASVEGLETVNALLRAVTAGADVPERELVLEDLEDFRRFLEIAEPLKIRFHMWWDV
ncbi:MAG TPA: hypothetical protein VFW40_14405 [Capsulimonadaceae bacterium]|nr:hypothetical protein [Capsulimonadaceae bacterium]